MTTCMGYPLDTMDETATFSSSWDLQSWHGELHEIIYWGTQLYSL